jgi:hypothetical protein
VEILTILILYGFSEASSQCGVMHPDKEHKDDAQKQECHNDMFIP